MTNPNHTPSPTTATLTPFLRVASCFFPCLFNPRQDCPIDRRDAKAYRLHHSDFQKLLEEQAKTHGLNYTQGQSTSDAVSNNRTSVLFIQHQQGTIVSEKIISLVASTCEALDRLHAEIAEEEEAKALELEMAKEVLENQFKGREGVNGFVSFYHSEQEEYSPAEGGCWFIRRTPVACYPARLFWNRETHSLDRTLLEAEAERLGLTLEGSEFERPDGTMRHARKICSSAPEADCEAFLETYPFSNACTIAPHYE